MLCCVEVLDTTVYVGVITVWTRTQYLEIVLTEFAEKLSEFA